MIGYSSSSHMGYVFLGMAALDYISLSGAVIYMFAHAMATGMLFAMAGWVYDQTHTRDIPSFGGLSNKMPFIPPVSWSVAWHRSACQEPSTLSPKIMIIVGSWNKYPLQVIVAVLGIVLTMAYLFKMMRGLFYGPMDQQYSHSHDAVSVVDRLPLLIMIAVSVGFGIFPMHLYNVVRSGVDPLVAKITHVVPLVGSEGRTEDTERETRLQSANCSARFLRTGLGPSGGASMNFQLTLSLSDLLLLSPEILLTILASAILIVDFSFPRPAQGPDCLFQRGRTGTDAGDARLVRYKPGDRGPLRQYVCPRPDGAVL